MDLNSPRTPRNASDDAEITVDDLKEQVQFCVELESYNRDDAYRLGSMSDKDIIDRRLKDSFNVERNDAFHQGQYFQRRYMSCKDLVGVHGEKITDVDSFMPIVDTMTYMANLEYLRYNLCFQSYENVMFNQKLSVLGHKIDILEQIFKELKDIIANKYTLPT
jgi:hypothetical protein